MSPVAKYNTKWIIGITTGLLTIMTFTFILGTGFAENNADHRAINTKIDTTDITQLEETRRSKETDKKLIESVSTIKTDIAVLREQGKQVNLSLIEIKEKLEKK